MKWPIFPFVPSFGIFIKIISFREVKCVKKSKREGFSFPPGVNAVFETRETYGQGTL